MKLAELIAKLALLQTEVRTLIATDTTAAESKMVEVRSLKAQISLLTELGEEEKREIIEQKKDKKVEEVSEMRSLVKQVMGKELTAEERAAITTTAVGTVIPKQFINKIIELEKGFGSLQYLCDEIPVTKSSGTIPVVDLDGQNELLDVVEGDAIVEGALVTTDIPFKVSKVGLLQELTSETIDDAEVEIEGLVQKNFTNISVANKNARILNIIKTKATSITGATSYEDVCKAIDSALPSVKLGLVTITNVTGYCYLKALKDTTGRKLDLITLVNGVEYFYGKPLVVVEDAMLAPTTAGKFVFYVANTIEAVKFCNRKEITVARSTEAGFKTDSVVLRILGRFGVVAGVTRSVKKIEFPVVAVVAA